MAPRRTPATSKPIGSIALREAALRLGVRLRALREARAMTLERAAEASDLNPVHIWKAEKGQLNVTLGTLTKLATAYGVDVEALFKKGGERARR